ncbi:MAG: hypothetical protein LIO54_02105 [Oscillospiraceae bacterium]|nr:hypothetical protein [Oscillospiraceae bacterium]
MTIESRRGMRRYARRAVKNSRLAKIAFDETYQTVFYSYFQIFQVPNSKNFHFLPYFCRNRPLFVAQMNFMPDMKRFSTIIQETTRALLSAGAKVRNSGNGNPLVSTETKLFSTVGFLHRLGRGRACLAMRF